MLFLLACTFHAPPTAPALSVANAPVRVVAVPTLSEDVVVAVAAGSAYDPPGREGLAWLTAHLIGLAAKTTPEVGPELVIFRVPIGEIPTLSQALVNPPITAEWLAAVPPPRWLDDCGAIAKAALDISLFAGHPYGHPVWGRSSTRASLSAAEVRAFYDRRYVRGATAAAAQNPTDLAGHLDGLAPRTASPITPTVLPPLTTSLPALLVVSAPVEHPCLAFGNREALPSDPTALAALDVVRAAWDDLAAEPIRRPQRFGIVIHDLLDADAINAVATTWSQARQDGLGAPVAEAHRRLGPAYHHRYPVDVLAHLLVPGSPDRRGVGARLAELTPTELDAAVRSHTPEVERLLRVLVVPRSPGVGGISGSLEGAEPARVPALLTAEELFR